MLHTTLAALAGTLAGLGGTVVVLSITHAVLNWMNAPIAFKIEHSVVYTTLVHGAGFGAVCRALVGLTGAIIRALRDRPS